VASESRIRGFTAPSPASYGPTMLPTESLSRLNALPDREREAALTRLAGRGIQPNGEIVAIKARVAAFEAKNRMTTQLLRGLLRDGTIKESSEISQWLFLADVLDDIR
jgi:hypothetical protein